MMPFKEVQQQLFPSEDGNQERRESLMQQISTILTSVDRLKDTSRSTLGEMKERSSDFYRQLIHQSAVPATGSGMDNVIDELMQLVQGHTFVNRNYICNVMPMASIPGILGALTTVLVNGNNIWDVHGPAGAEAEVRVMAMMSKRIGYDPEKSLGYTTWGGQGAVFTGLRLAIAKQFPRAKEEGVPNNLYCFASEVAHYSLLKSVEATGIGSNRLILIKTKPDHSMDMQDLHDKMSRVISEGGIPLFVLATTGTTDSFGIDDVRAIKQVCDRLTRIHRLKPVHIHADSALGGFYAFFNDYDFAANPLALEAPVLQALEKIRERMRHLALSDTMCFDFHKLGQTPYVSSLLLVKNGQDLSLLDLDEYDTPYVGNRGYGSYHTSYTLECSRAASSIAIYATLLAFGIEGYQQLLANYVRVNHHFRSQLLAMFPNVVITNADNPGPVTTFRFYPERTEWIEEVNGRASSYQVERNNAWNNSLFERLGRDREQVFFGDTKKQCLVNVTDSQQRHSISAVKFFSVSPYTEVEHVDDYLKFLKERVLNNYIQNLMFNIS